MSSIGSAPAEDNIEEEDACSDDKDGIGNAEDGEDDDCIDDGNTDADDKAIVESAYSRVIEDGSTFITSSLSLVEITIVSVIVDTAGLSLPTGQSPRIGRLANNLSSSPLWHSRL